MLTAVPLVRFSLQPIGAAERHSAERASFDAPKIGIFVLHGLTYGYGGDLFMLPIFFFDSPGAPAQAIPIDLESEPANDANARARFGAEPFEQRTFDFGRRCLNTCRLGGWGACAIETRAKNEECESIAGRTVISAAARRAPLVRDILKLVGSRTTALPSDVEQGLHLSAGITRGGGTVGIEARW